MILGFWMTWLALSFWAAPADAVELRVAAASSLQFAAQDLAQAFEKNSGYRVRLTLGASGTIYSQINHGAPFDLFLSADTSYPSRLQQAGRTLQMKVYARGRLVLWVRSDSGLDPGRQGWTILQDPGVLRVALANPRHAPYGEAALQLLRSRGLEGALREKLVWGESILQAAQFVESGAAQVGMIALSLALSPPLRDKGRYWLIPIPIQPNLDHAAVVIAGRPALQTEGAGRFLEWLTGPAGQSVLQRYGLAISD